jgi:hypothetical protein
MTHETPAERRAGARRFSAKCAAILAALLVLVLVAQVLVSCGRQAEPPPTPTATLEPLPIMGSNPAGVTHLQNLAVATAITTGGDVTSSGDLSVTDITAVDVTVSSELTVTTSISTAGDISIGDDLAVGDDASITADLTVGDELTVTTSISTPGDISIGDDLLVVDDVTINDALTVNGRTEITGAASIGGDLTVTGYLQADSASGISVTTGPLFYYIDDTAVTTDTTLVATNAGTVYHNTGAGGAIVLTLPAAAEGINFCFYTAVAENFDINPAEADQIAHLTNSAGDAIRNATIGDSVCLLAIDGTYWIPLQETGTWSDAN